MSTPSKYTQIKILKEKQKHILWEGFNPRKAVGHKEKIKFKGPEED